MAPPRPKPKFLKRQCWDSAMFITLATKQSTEEGRKRVETINELLSLFEKKQIEIVMSTMAIVEFRPYPERELHDPTTATIVDDLFNSTDIFPYAVTPDIAAMAREIGEKHHRLTPTDTIHIATAIVAKADVLFTFDGAKKIGNRRRQKDMIMNSGKIGTPPMKIAEPFVDLGPMFDEQIP